jgi:hypothetical protein
MKKITPYFLFILLEFVSADTFAQYTSFRIHPSANHQIEPMISRHPVNHDIMFVSSYNVVIGTSFRSEGVYVTTNGGLTWFGSDSCTGAPLQNHAGDPGPIIDKDGRLLLTHLGNFPSGMFGNFSTDFGLTWSNNATIASGDNDKGSPATDDLPLSPYYGRTYLAWSRFISPFPVVFSFTSNGGNNWTALQQINASIGGHQSLGAGIAAGPNGVVYVTWASVILSFPFNEDFLGFASSSNGGVNWVIAETAIDINGIKTSSLAPWGIRVNSYPGTDVDKTGGSRSGWIYIVTAEKNHSPAGSDPDIVFFRSTNGGSSWSQGIRVNQDPINNGKVQYFPAMRVDESGGINIVYYDNRNTTQDSMSVYLSRSTNGGNSWSDYSVSNHRFKPQSIVGAGTGNQGDNIGITSGNGKHFPVWMDNSAGIYQVWTAVIDYTSIGIKKISTVFPEKFGLEQNYPNPFNPTTKIKFEVPKSGPDNNLAVKLKVYNIHGKLISTLYEGNLSPGKYETVFDATNLPSGVYIYRIETSYFTDAKKMVLVK